MIEVPTTIEGVKQWLVQLKSPRMRLHAGIEECDVQLVWASGLTLASGGHPTIQEALQRVTDLYEDYVVASTERP